MMPETLSSQPCCSGSVNHQNSFFYNGRRRRRHDFGTHIQYISCSAIFSHGVHKTRGCGRISLAVKGLRIPESFPPFRSTRTNEFKNRGFAQGNGSILEPHEGTLVPFQDDHSIVWDEPVSGIQNEIYYLEERDESVLSKRILELSRCNRVRSALALYRSMKFSSLQPEPHACNSLLACLIRNRRVDDALEVFQFMKSKQITTGHSYSLILKAVADSHGFHAALTLFEEAERDQMDLIVYNTMVGIFGKVNNWSEAEKIWRIMQENGIVGSVITYRLLVCVFVRCNRNELALDAYDEMVRNGLTPCDDVLQAVMGACSREGMCDMALSVLQTMLGNGIKPSLTTCNALISMLAKTSQLEKAFEVYDMIVSFGHTPDAYSWNALLVALNHAGRYGDSLQLLETIRKRRKDVLNLHMYNTCLVSSKKLGLWERAVQLLWDMEVAGIHPNVTSYSLAIGACEAAGEPAAALRVYRRMIRQQHSPNSFTLLPVIRACIFGSLWSELENILDSTPNELLYNVAIRGLCLKKEMNMARKMYTKMCEIGLKPDRKTRGLMQQNLWHL